jgi:hypothetical protein
MRRINADATGGDVMMGSIGQLRAEMIKLNQMTWSASVNALRMNQFRQSKGVKRIWQQPAAGRTILAGRNMALQERPGVQSRLREKIVCNLNGHY